MRLPEGMRVVTAEPDRMRAVLDERWDELVLEATDTYARPGPDLLQSTKADLQNQGLAGSKITRLELAGLSGVGVVPAAKLADHVPRLVYAAYVAAPDSSVRTFAFYVRAKGDDAQWLARAQRIAASLAVETPRPPFRPGKLGFRELTLTLAPPAPWRVVPRSGQAFTYRLLKPALLGTPPVGCEITIAGVPPGGPGAEPVTRQGMLAGAPVEWRQWTLAGELLLIGSRRLPGAVLGVARNAPDQARLDEISRILAGLTYTPE